MAIKEQLKRLKDSIAEENDCKAWNEWRSAHPHTKIDLKNASLYSANLRWVNLSFADLDSVNLQSADLYSANLSSTDLRSANLHSANLYSTDLRSADLCSASLYSANLISANLHNVKLQSANLRTAKLRSANLCSANLYSANLSSADLHSANLYSANLGSTDLHSASLISTNLISTNLVSANLRLTNFSLANLWNADLSDSRTYYTVWGNVDLSEVKENCLEKVDHKGPSILGVDTLFKSKGEIPKVFLEKCGLQDWEIETAKLYRPGLTPEEHCEIIYKIQDARFGGPLPIGGVFISYSHADKKFVIDIEERLKKEGARVWRDEHDLKAGDLNKQVWKGLRAQDVVLLVLSKKSTESDWVESELEMARMLEKKEKRDILCPIALDKSWEDKCEAGGADRQLWRTLKKKAILPFKKNRSDIDVQTKKLIDGLRENYQAIQS